jgi:Transposase domain (DUF772)
MKRFIEGEERSQVTLLPDCLDDYIAEDNPVRVDDVFVDELKLCGLGFDGAEPAATGRPSYHPAVLLKIYIYGYINQVQSSRGDGLSDQLGRWGGGTRVPMLAQSGYRLARDVARRTGRRRSCGSSMATGARKCGRT